jgi:hypothetical protein
MPLVKLANPKKPSDAERASRGVSLTGAHGGYGESQCLPV